MTAKGQLLTTVCQEPVISENPLHDDHQHHHGLYGRLLRIAQCFKLPNYSFRASTSACFICAISSPLDAT